MGLILDRLGQQVQKVQAFAGDRVAEDKAYSQISHALTDLERLLTVSTPILRIIGTDQKQSQALQQLLLTYPDLPKQYQITTSALPHDHSTLAPAPVLQMVATELAQPPRFELSIATEQVLGRNPQAAQILLPDQLGLVSGCHAKLEPLADGKWQITDLQSRNGTFINSSLLEPGKIHILQADDRIGLGSALLAKGSATLVYECPNPQPNSTTATVRQFLDCNVICLVTAPNQPFLEQVKQLFSLANMPFAKGFIILAKTGDANLKAVQSAAIDVTDWIQNSPYRDRLEVIPLLLQPFVPNAGATSSGATMIAPHAQPEFEQWCARLEDLARNHAEAMIAQRLRYQLIEQLYGVEQILQKQDILFQQIVQQRENKLSELTPLDLKERIKKALKKINDERDQFFRQARNELNQSKASILDEFRKNSIPYQIQQFAKTLQPVATDRGGYRYVSLKLEKQRSVHAAAIDCCHTLLSEWGKDEWQRISGQHGNGGLKGLLQRSLEALVTVPDLNAFEALPQLTTSPNFQPILQLSSAEPVIELRFKQPGLIGYLLKNLKGQVISGVATVALIAQVVNWIVQITAQANSESNSSQVDTLKFAITAIILLICLIAIPIAYQRDTEDKTRESAEKLQKETTNYYQSFAKGLVDKFVQQLLFAIEIEEKQFREFVETVSDQCNLLAVKFEKNYIQSKASLEEQKKNQQKKVEQDIAEMRRLKKEIAS
ncbi:MAG: hypothetical protein Kow00121_10640 [Elainellaceae cyanobacterium]